MSNNRCRNPENPEMGWAESRKLQKQHARPDWWHVGYSSKSERRCISRKWDTSLHNKNRPLSLHSNPKMSFFFVHPSSLWAELSDDTNWWVFTESWSFVCGWSQRIEREPTHIVLYWLWKAVKSETWLRPNRLPWNLGVKQYVSNSAHHHGPHSLSTCYVNRSCQLECRSHCDTWRSMWCLYSRSHTTVTKIRQEDWLKLQTLVCSTYSRFIFQRA